MSACADGGVLVRVLYAAVDPAMRGWLSTEPNYLTVPDGAVMRAEGIGEVLESRHPAWQAGDCVYGIFGWQQYAAVPASELHWRIDTRIAPAPVWLGALGLNGLTAWVGLHHIGQVRAGDTVLVSTAAGAVGSVVGCLARAAGLRAIGLTGSAAKAQRCVEQFGYAAALNYKSVGDLSAAVKAACPQGIELFYDNAGGAIADAVFPVLNNGARIVQCGTAAVSSWLAPPAGPRRERDMLVRRLHWRGFVVRDHTDLYPQALAELTRLYVAGGLAAPTEVLEGLESAPESIGILYSGRNQGRLCIRP